MVGGQSRNQPGAKAIDQQEVTLSTQTTDRKILDHKNFNLLLHCLC